MISTNRQYIQATLSRFNVDADTIDLIMADHDGLDVQSLDVRACKMAMYQSLSNILPLANISEGGYSISWNTEAFKLWYKSLCSELGVDNVLEDDKMDVEDRSYMW